jgi:ADP-ribose pyrophosphatase YjhB (NUDIX family)
MHEIQKEILQKLSLQKRARYSELKRKELDGNLFVYHLNSLKKKGIVTAKDKTYILTSEGKQLLSRISFSNLKERIQPKIVTTIIIKQNNKYLLYRQTRAPFIDYVSFPYGKIHLDESIKDAANRELYEKTGYTAKLQHRGDVYITLHDETEMVTQTLHHVFTGTKPVGEIQKEYPGGECFCGTFDNLDKKMILPGAEKMLKLVEKNKNNHFFAEFFLNITDE